MDKVNAGVEKTALDQLIERYLLVTASLSESSRATDRSIIKKFLRRWPYSRDFQVRQVRSSMLDEWLAHEAPPVAPCELRRLHRLPQTTLPSR